MISRGEDNYSIHETNWHNTPMDGDIDVKRKEKTWNRIHASVTNGHRKNILVYKRWMNVAAIAIIFLGVSFLLPQVVNKSYSKQYGSYNTENATVNNISFIVLPDGSKIWLNSHSKIKYDSAFNKKERVVQLEGEAFFDVAKNPDRPFIIYTGNIKTLVLGTSFNIKAYSGIQPAISVSTGKVQVEDLVGEKRIYLTAGQMAVVDERSEKIALEKSNDKDIAWKARIIDVNNKTLKQVATEISRIKNVDIQINDSVSGAQVLEGSFDTQHSIQDIMKSLSFILDIDYTIINNKVTIK